MDLNLKIMTGVILASTLLGLLFTACSIKKFAVRQVGDALASGTSVYETDPDVELIGDALPFSLKLVESLLEITPRNRGLLLTAARGFTLYSYAYVDFPGEQLIEEDYEKGRALRQRAKRLYMRAQTYGLRALDVVYPGIEVQLASAPDQAVQRVSKKHVDLLYWTGAALGLSISTDSSNAALLVRLAEVNALIGRAIELDAGWDQGSLYEFQLKLAAAKPGENDPVITQQYFQKALELSGGKRAGLYISYAEAVAIPSQNRELFEEMIAKTLQVDADAHEQYRLLNHLAHRRAHWLQSRIEDYFL